MLLHHSEALNLVTFLFQGHQPVYSRVMLQTAYFACWCEIIIEKKKIPGSVIHRLLVMHKRI